MGHVGFELARILSRHDLELFLVDSRAEMLATTGWPASPTARRGCTFIMRSRPSRCSRSFRRGLTC
jgi:hypothetical protein